MKGLWAVLAIGLIVWGLIYYHNQGKTGQGVLAPAAPAPQETYEPLILDSKADTSFFSTAAHAAEPAQEEKAAPTYRPQDVRMLGDENAPITMYLFSSMTCGHCVTYHNEILPKIQEKYIDTGKVKLIYVDFPFDRRSLAGTMLTRCADPNNYWKFLNVLFENQDQWAFKSDAQDIIMNYAALEGMTKADVKACLANKNLMESIVQTRDAFMKKYKIQGTPTTVFIKGDKTKNVGGADLKALEQAIKELE